MTGALEEVDFGGLGPEEDHLPNDEHLRPEEDQ